MPAWIQHSEAIRLKDLLGCLHVERDRFPLTQLATARVGVERIGDVQKVSPMGQQPLDAVVTAAAFLTCRQCEDVVTGGDYAFLLHSQEGRDPRRHAVLHVERTAPVEVAVAFRELEWVELPVRTARLHHVQVTDEQDWLPGSSPAIPDDQVPVLRVPARVRPDDLNVGRRKPRGPKPRRQPLRRLGRATARIRRVRFDQLSQDVPAERLLGGQRSLRSGVARREEETDRKRENWTHEDYLT